MSQKLILICIVLILTVSECWGTTPLGERITAGAGTSVVAGPGQGHWRTYGVPEGLAHNRVWSSFLDRDGNLWFGTQAGLSRYDGERFTTFTTKDGLAGNPVQSIFQDREGILWFGCGSAGLSRYDPSAESIPSKVEGLRTGSQAFTNFRLEGELAEFAISSVFQDRDGIFWFGYSGGVIRYDPSTKSIPSAVEGIKTGSEAFTNFTEKDGLVVRGMKSIVQDHEGNLWFCTFSRGVSRYDGKNFTTLTAKDGLKGPIWSMIMDRDGNLWFASLSGGAIKYDGKKFTALTTEDGLADNRVFALIQDRDGVFWFGTDTGGVSRYDPALEGQAAWTTFTAGDGLAQNTLRSIVEDRDGNIWFSTWGGVSRYDGRTLTTFNKENGLPHDNVMTIKKDRDGILWFGTQEGLCRYDGKVFTTLTTADGLRNNSVFSILQDREGSFWFGSIRGEVNRYDGETFTGLRMLKNPSDQSVISMIQDRDGLLWFGAYSGGMSHYDGKKVTPFAAKGGVPQDKLRAVKQDRQGVFWFATRSEGLGRYDPSASLRTGSEKFTTFTTDDGLLNNKLTSVYEDRDGVLWFGSESGVSSYDPSAEKVTFTNFTSDDGLAQGSVHSIMQDREGKFWFGTWGGGVSRFDGKTFTTLTTKDGLVSNNVFSIVQDQDGAIWFGTYGGGATRFRMPEPNPPPVSIDAVLADHRYDNVSDIAIPSTVELVAFEFHGKSFRTRPEAMGYHYRLNGYDVDWKNTRERRVEYENLPRGTYTFEVKAVDRDLVYSETPATMTLTVHWPYERIGWMSSLGIAIVLIGWQAVRIIRRGQQLQETNEALSDANHELFGLNKDLELASEQAQKANHAKSRFLASMSHELRTPLNGILGYAQILERDKGLNEKQRDGVGIIQRSGDHLLGLINDILDLARIEAEKVELEEREIGLPAFLKNVSAISDVKAQEKGLTFVSDVSPGLPEVVMGDPRRLRQVLLNLLGNAMKFTEKGEVKFSIGIVSQKDDQIRVRFEVTDSGVGMTEQEAQEVFKPFEQAGGADKRAEGTGLGLAISQQLVGLMGGEIQVESELGKGSRFWFEADLKTVDAQADAFVQEERVPVGFKGDSRQVLVVDDTAENRAVLISLLEPLGFEVLEAEDGQVSLDMAMESKPDVILLDMVMPVLDGFETAQKLRQIDELKDTVVIALSASVFEEERQQSLDAGCTDFLPKPVIAEDLLQKLSTHLDLEWMYDASDAVSVEVETVTGELVIPPADALKPLFEMAQKGQIFGIEEQIDGIAKLGDEYRPFVAELQNLAEDFKVDQICTLIKPHLDDE